MPARSLTIRPARRRAYTACDGGITGGWRGVLALAP